MFFFFNEQVRPEEIEREREIEIDRERDFY